MVNNRRGYFLISSLKRLTGSKAIIDAAVRVLKIEAQGILNLVDHINEDFVNVVQMIFKSRGRVIIAGIGKSGIIGRKIAATLNSTGTRAVFLHPVEAMHGDLGMVSREDIFLALSNSGETDELNILLPSIRSTGCPIIAFTGKPLSTLARHSDVVINVGVEAEACPMGLAPTASTTAQLAMGDALAVVLINMRKFSQDDFKKFHPGGLLGQRLSYQAKDIMLTGASVPKVYEGADIQTALEIIDKGELGVVMVLNSDDILTGIITDGDVRRMVVNRQHIEGHTVESLMTPDPKHIDPGSPLYEALNIMEAHQITVLPVTEANGRLAGVLHLHDILGKGALTFNGVR
jgi:arabinose-5-phosphate isomerase